MNSVARTDVIGIELIGVWIKAPSLDDYAGTAL
jgi:hypothetical protein